MSIGQRLKVFRKKYNLTQKDIAQLMGIDQPAIVKYEKDISSIPIDKLVNIAKEYKLNINWLILGKGNIVSEYTSYNDKPIEIADIDLNKGQALRILEKITDINCDVIRTAEKISVTNLKVAETNSDAVKANQEANILMAALNDKISTTNDKVAETNAKLTEKLLTI